MADAPFKDFCLNGLFDIRKYFTYSKKAHDHRADADPIRQLFYPKDKPRKTGDHIESNIPKEEPCQGHHQCLQNRTLG